MFNRTTAADLAIKYAIEADKLKTSFVEKLEAIVSRNIAKIETIKDAKNILDSEQRQAEAERDEAAKAILSL